MRPYAIAYVAHAEKTPLAEFGREDHGSIPATIIGRELRLLNARTHIQIRLNGK
jgi:hypothetical protein